MITDNKTCTLKSARSVWITTWTSLGLIDLAIASDAKTKPTIDEATSMLQKIDNAIVAGTIPITRDGIYNKDDFFAYCEEFATLLDGIAKCALPDKHGWIQHLCFHLDRDLVRLTVTTTLPNETTQYLCPDKYENITVTHNDTATELSLQPINITQPSPTIICKPTTG